VVVDPKGHGFERYRLATVIKPNLKELAEATGLPTADTVSQEFAARKLLDLTAAGFILLTRGPAGMLLVPRDEPCSEFNALAREVYDVSGAGDTVAAVLAAALGSGAGIREAVELANIAAGIVVGKVGTAVATRSEIIDEIEHESAIDAGSKILSPPQAAERVDVWQRMGRRVGVTRGCFQPLTADDLAWLERARACCDRLVVGVTYSGAGVSADDLHARAFLLASLVYVDAVVVCDPRSPAEMERLRLNGSGGCQPRLLDAASGETLLAGPVIP